MLECSYEEARYSLSCSIFYSCIVDIVVFLLLLLFIILSLTLWLFAYQIFSRHFHSVFTLHWHNACALPRLFYSVSSFGFFLFFFFSLFIFEFGRVLKALWNRAKSLFVVVFLSAPVNEIWHENKYYASLCHQFTGCDWLAGQANERERVIRQHDSVLNNTDNDDYVNDML